MRDFIRIKDWYWEQDTEKMVYTDEKGQKYTGKPHGVTIGKLYAVEIEDVPAKDDYIHIIRWI